MSCLSSRIPDSRMMSGTKCSVALPMLHSKQWSGWSACRLCALQKLVMQTVHQESR